jgi:hypothetical protein
MHIQMCLVGAQKLLVLPLQAASATAAAAGVMHVRNIHAGGWTEREGSSSSLPFHFLSSADGRLSKFENGRRPLPFRVASFATFFDFDLTFRFGR